MNPITKLVQRAGRSLKRLVSLLSFGTINKCLYKVLHSFPSRSSIKRLQCMIGSAWKHAVKHGVCCSIPFLICEPSVVSASSVKCGASSFRDVFADSAASREQGVRCVSIVFSKFLVLAVANLSQHESHFRSKFSACGFLGLVDGNSVTAGASNGSDNKVNSERFKEFVAHNFGSWLFTGLFSFTLVYALTMAAQANDKTERQPRKET
jgi:hypothetical protein